MRCICTLCIVWVQIATKNGLMNGSIICRQHSQKSSTVEIANIKMKTGEGYLLDGCRAWRCELVATGIVEARKGEPMSDLISRADAISVLDNFTQTDTLGHTPRQIVEALPSAQPEVTDEAVREYCRKRCLCIVDGALLKKYASTQPTIEQDWTSCKKPPTKNDAYLVTVHPDYIVPGGGQVDILVWVDDGWFFVDYGGKIARFPDPVIAWRPLPAPYKEES